MSADVQEPALLLTVGEAGRRLAASERYTWELIARGDLEVVRLGTKATRVVASSLTRYIDRLRSEAAVRGDDTT